MKFLQRLFLSSIGKKFIMAVTGVCLVMFLFGHMVGNLQLFVGRDELNAYAHFLQSTKELLWTARLGLIALIALHIWSATALTMENRAARPIPYDQAQLTAASYASRTMIWSGVIITAFVVYHLLHFTIKTQAINGTGTDFNTLIDVSKNHADVYKMVITGFGNGWVVLFYTVAIGLLCWHLSHGIEALFQSLGLKNKTWAPIIHHLSKLTAIALFFGYIAVPAAIKLFGYGKEILK
jgi:succinate dehydrogenase / fumarate reductase cytochrome b subunit